MDNINKTKDIKKIIPSNIHAEQTVLGGILLESHLMGISLNRIKSNYFYKEAHQIIYDAMIELYNYKKSIDPVTVSEVLRQNRYLDDVGGINYLTSLTTIYTCTNSYNHCLDIIIELHLRREGIKLTSIIRDLLYNGRMEDINQKVMCFNRMLENKRSVEDLYINASDVKKQNEEEEFISTGFNMLDRMLSGGFKSKSLVILTGEPGSGKSTLINQFLASSISEGNKVFLYSGELPVEDLMRWFNITAARKSHIIEKVNSQGIENRDVTDICWDKISKWVENKMIIYGDDSEATMSNIVACIENLVKTKNFKLFILDNLMTMDLEESDDKYQQQKNLCNKLKVLAKKYKIVIMLVAHPKKPSGVGRHSMHDVSGASEIVGVADTVIKIVRSEDENGVQKSKVLLLKNRWGGTINRVLPLDFDEKRRRFYNTDYEHYRDYNYDR